jgi:hypothetical protein
MNICFSLREELHALKKYGWHLQTAMIGGTVPNKDWVRTQATENQGDTGASLPAIRLPVEL